MRQMWTDVHLARLLYAKYQLVEELIRRDKIEREVNVTV